MLKTAEDYHIGLDEKDKGILGSILSKLFE